MDKITTLILQYKKTKDQNILNEIFEILNPVIQKKAKYIYYGKWYPINLYHPCKFCRNCNKLNNIPKSEHKIICQECQVCRCEKGFFNLNKNNLCEYKDIENDIWLEILRIIENFDIAKNFNTYLYSCLWEFIPTFITKNFIKSLSNQSLSKVDQEGNESEMEIPDEPKQTNNFNLEHIYSVCKNETEQKIIKLLIAGLKQIEIAKELCVSEQYISKIIIKLRKKITKLLNKDINYTQ